MMTSNSLSTEIEPVESEELHKICNPLSHSVAFNWVMNRSFSASVPPETDGPSALWNNGATDNTIRSKRNTNECSERKTRTHTKRHAHTHTCFHTYIHTCIHTYLHTNMHIYIHTYIHTYIYTHTPTANPNEIKKIPDPNDIGYECARKDTYRMSAAHGCQMQDGIVYAPDPFAMRIAAAPSRH
jgi:hypothetical protein